MGGSDSSSQQQTATQQTTQLPPWINQAAQQNYAQAQNIANQPLQQYQGQLVPNVSPQMQQSWNTAATGGSAGQSQYDAANAGYLGVLGSTPQQITAAQGALADPTKAAQAATAQAATAPATIAQQAALSSLNGMNLQGYMNPYTKSVIDQTLPVMNQSLAQQQNALQNQANASNAFGGSRQAITQGVLGAQGAMGEGQMAAQLNQANYAQAQAAGEFDVGQANQMGEFNANQMNTVGMYNQGQANQANQFNANQSNQVGMYNAGQSNQVGMYNQGQANNMNQFNAAAQNTAAYQNQQAGLTQEGLANTAAGGLANLGNEAQLSQARNFTEQMTAGTAEQAQQQAEINANLGQFNQAWQYPYQQLGVLQSALGMTPYGTSQQGLSTTNSQTQTSANPLGMALGGLGALGSLFGGSDRRLKTDITKVGTHPAGLGIYSFRYKGDPKSYPKVVGPMAEDVAKIAPGAVAKIPGSGGKMAVHMPTLNALASPMAPALPTRAVRPQLPIAGGASPAVPGALAGPSPFGPVGALGGSMRAVRGGPITGSRAIRPRMPQMRGALSG